MPHLQVPVAICCGGLIRSRPAWPPDSARPCP